MAMFDPDRNGEPRPEPVRDNIISFDQYFPLDARRTIRSTCYREKFERLDPEGRARVELMEAKLFAQGYCKASCERDVLHIPRSRFDCDEGSIWYHFSKGEGRFILTDFTLHRRGSGETGGCDGGFPFCDPYPVAAALGHGIAARLDRLFAADWSRTSGADLAAWLATAHDRTFTLWLDDRMVCIDDPTPNGQLLIEIAASWHLMTDADSETALPDWSLLRRASPRREQLENPYARAIFAGEALCRIGVEIAHHGLASRALRLGPFLSRSGRLRTKRREERALLGESIAILDAVRSGSGHELGQHVCHYFTASLMDHEMLYDVRRLALIRSEMTYRLAMAIGAGEPCHSGRGLRWSMRRARADVERDRLHRYALLSEFARLSADYFGVTEPTPSAGDVVGELDACLHKGSAVVERLVHDLDDFGISAMLIVEQLTPRSVAPSSDLDSLYPRLRALTEAILDEKPPVSLATGIENIWLTVGDVGQPPAAPVD